MSATLVPVLVKLLSILITLPSFGVQPNPNAPKASEVIEYAPPRADAMMFLDVAAIVPNNYKAITKDLASHREVRSDKAAREALAQGVQMIEMGRTMAKTTAGIDPVTDVSWISAWVDYPDAGDPNFLIVVRGTFPKDLIQKIAGMAGGKVKRLGGGEAVVAPGGDEMMGMTDDGTLLVGSPRWVEPRMSKRWRRKGRFRNLPKLLDGGPFFVVASSPSRRAIRRFSREIKDPEAAALKDLLTGHTFAGVSFAHDALEWRWSARSRRGHERAVQISEGMIDLLRAGHLATRGMARMILGIAQSYGRTSPELAQVLKHQDRILKMVDAVTGDGSFKVKIDSKPGKRDLHVRAWDKELSDVIPLAAGLPLVSAGAFLMVSGSAESKAIARPPPVRAP